ncbi:MAG: tryptophan synthase subunit beta [Myxococcales bacterium]|nr:tryptophan synthase subunit beta [Myxococcales bacterium]
MIENGFYGEFGGYYVSELLIPCLTELEKAFVEIKDDPSFHQQLKHLLNNWAGRPTPLYRSAWLSEELGCEAYLKREDLLHGGAHKTNNTAGQGLLAQRMGKKRIIAETGAGQHGVATAMIGALLGLDTTIYMGAKDVARQAPNVARMRLFGAKIISVESGGASLKGAINDALRAWTERVHDTFYVFGTAAGPHPYPAIVKTFQKIIGEEIAEQLGNIGARPKAIVASVGGGSNAIGAFAPFIQDESVMLLGAEPGGDGVETGRHGAALSAGRPGSLHGAISYVLQDKDGQIGDTHSVSAGLDYPGVGPEHSHLHACGRAEYAPITDAEALESFVQLCRYDGILPALESAHAVALARKCKSRFGKGDHIVINLSGRGDKDMDHAMNTLQEKGISL